VAIVSKTLLEFKEIAMQRPHINAEFLRGRLLGALASFWALSLAAAPPSALAQAHDTLTVRSVAFNSAAKQPEIEVKTSGPVAPATQAITGPDRIIIDFPGALPASTLHAIAVHRGGLKGVRAALFQAQPPITRVVLDVDGPTDYQIVPSGNSIVIRLGKPDQGQSNAGQTVATKAVAPPNRMSTPASQLPALQVVNTTAVPQVVAAAEAPAPPPRPKVEVAVSSNLLSIHAQGATLAEVLYEVHRRTGAEIAIPAGAEQERVVVSMGPAPGKEVIASLLNGSRFNYILVGSDSDPGGFKNLLLSLKSGGNSGVFVHTAPPQMAGQFSAGPTQTQPPQMNAPSDPGAEQIDADPAGVAQAEPELEPTPDEQPAPEANGDITQPAQRPTGPQQFPVQTIPEPGQAPQ
jgi:AMIN domain